MTCEECDIASNGVVHPLEWRRFDPSCVVCGGRCIAFLRCMRGVEKDRKARRMTQALDDWLAYGHSEQQLRELASKSWSEWGAWANEYRRRRN